MRASRLGLTSGDFVQLPSRSGAIYRSGLVVSFSHGEKTSDVVLVQVIWRGAAHATWHPVGVLRRVGG